MTTTTSATAAVLDLHEGQREVLPHGLRAVAVDGQQDVVLARGALLLVAAASADPGASAQTRLPPLTAAAAAAVAATAAAAAITRCRCHGAD